MGQMAQMEQNDQIKGMSFGQLRTILGLKPFEQYEAEQQIANVEKVSKIFPEGPERDDQIKTRGTGRTTKLLLDCLVEMTKGRKVAILVPTEAFGRNLVRILDEWCQVVLVKTGFRIHNLARPILLSDWRDQNETLFSDHSFKENK